MTTDFLKGLGQVLDSLFFWAIVGMISAVIFGIAALIGLGWGIWWLYHHFSFVIS